MTIEEHVAEADRLMEQATDHDVRSDTRGTELAHRDIALARAHLHAAQVLSELQGREDSRSVMRDMKGMQAFLGEGISKMLPGGDGLA